MSEYKNGQILYIAHDGQPITFLNSGETNKATIQMGATHLTIENATAGGNVVVNGANSVQLKIGAAFTFSVTAALVSLNPSTAVSITSTKPVRFGATTRYLVDSGTDIHLGLAAGAMFGPAVTSQNDLGDATHVFQTLYTEVVNFFDTTGAENASITRNLTDFLFNSGTGGNYIFQIGGTPQWAMEANKLYPSTTSAFDFGDATHIAQTIYHENLFTYDTTGNDVTKMWQMPPLLTADAVQTTMETITLADNHAYTIEVKATAMETDGSDRRGFIKSGVFYRDGAGAVQEGATVSQMNEGSAAALLDFTVNGNDVRVSATGPGAENWNWTGRITVVELD